MKIIKKTKICCHSLDEKKSMEYSHLANWHLGTSIWQRWLLAALTSGPDGAGVGRWR
jgi:hypothetical protein